LLSVEVSYKKQTALVLLLFVIFLVVVEVVATFFVMDITACKFKNSELFDNIDTKLLETMCDDHLSLDRMYNEYFQLAPNQYFDTISINEFGFRGSDFLYDKPQNVFRIFMVGGSTIFGVGSSSDQTSIPGYLQKNLNNFPSSTSIQVINAGYPSANSFSESKFVRDVLLQFDPDMIIVYDGWNELQQPSEMLQQQTINPISSFLKDVRVLFPFYNTPILISEMGGRTLSQFSESLFDEGTEYQKIIWWKNNWSEICELSHKQGFDLIISVQPIIGTGEKPLTIYEKQILNSDPNFSRHAKFIPNFVSAMHDLEFCDYALDLTTSFDDISEPIYFDQGHMSDTGNSIIADKFSEYIYPILLNRLPSIEK
jgi:lysophospholipase L1-like esterase